MDVEVWLTFGRVSGRDRGEGTAPAIRREDHQFDRDESDQTEGDVKRAAPGGDRERDDRAREHRPSSRVEHLDRMKHRVHVWRGFSGGGGTSLVHLERSSVGRAVFGSEMAGFNLRKTLGRSCHVCDQLSELGVRQAATHAVEASRYRGQKLLVSLVLPVMQKGLMPSRKPIIRLDEAGFAAEWAP